MIRRPLTFTFFPYTTLFRSEVLGAHDVADRVAMRAAAEAVEEALVLDDVERRGLFVVERADPVDRKSTRLNSSHRCISYAVFCLKEKKDENEKFYEFVNSDL